MLPKIVPLPYPIAKHIKKTIYDAKIKAGTDRVFSIVPKVDAKGELFIYENSIIYKNPLQQKPDIVPPERTANDIKEFSAQSRKNLFDKFNRLNYSAYGVPLFLSCTYHYDFGYDRAQLKDKIELFIKRLQRVLFSFDYIWKLEYQKRGAPHFHFILFPLHKQLKFFSEEKKKAITKHWLELKDCKCDSCKEYSIKIIEMKTYKMALSYIAKEIAKVEQNYCSHDLGRVWSSSNNMREEELDKVSITPKQFHSYLDKAILILQEKLKLLNATEIKKIDSLNKSITYITSLKESNNNCTIYIDHKQIDSLTFDFKLLEKIKTVPKSFILKKYSWK